MNKKSLFSLLLATTMIGQSLTVTSTVHASENLVGHEQLTSNSTQAPAKDTVVPDANQYEYQKQELAAFCHFGPNTFNNIEWGENYGTKEPNEIFKLKDNFDADTYVKTIKEAGFKKLIVTAKHHDGFCIWDSKHTEYDVAATDYAKNNIGEFGGDVLAEISKACTDYDIDMGLYLSPWDIHDKSYGYKDKDGNPLLDSKGNPLDNKTWEQVEEEDVLDYNKYYNDQLIEILGNDKYGNNGHFVEVWMDGAKGSGSAAQNYTFQEWFKTIQKYEGKGVVGKDGKPYEADCMLFGAEAYTTVRWIGNENGIAAEETWAKSTVNKKNNTIDSNKKDGFFKGFENGNQWTVPEADARITDGWFWGPGKKTPKSITDLATMYFNSVGHNATLLLNFPPNDKGQLEQEIINRTIEFGKNINDTFKTNLAKDAVAKATAVRGNDTQFSPNNVLDGNDDTYWTVNDNTTTGSLVLELTKDTTFDVVSIEEAIQFGQRIKSFKVEYSIDGSEWKLFDEGTTIGAKRLSRKSPVTADKLKITVTTSSAVPMISEVGVYKATAGFELKGAAPEGMTVIDELDAAFKLNGTWNKESGQQYLNNSNMWAKKGASFTMEFEGSKAYIVGTLDTGHGKAKVTIDDGAPVEIDTHAAKRQTGAIIFTSDDLTYGKHTLKLEVTDDTKAIGVEGAYVINNNGVGMIGIEHANYEMNENSEMKMKLVRVGGTKGDVTVKVSPNPGTAIQDDFDTEGIYDVTFKDGESEKNVVIVTRRNENKTGDIYFTEELSTTDKNVILGFNSKATITILDQEGQPPVETTKSQKLDKEAYGTPTATSEEKNNKVQTIDKAFDQDLSTFWHAQWGDAGKLQNHKDGISVTIPLKEAKELTKLSYIPRSDDAGTIGNYKVEVLVSAEGEEEKWETVSEGTFKRQGQSQEEQFAVFNKPVTTSKVRFTALSMAGGEHPTATEIALYEKVEGSLIPEEDLITVTVEQTENGIVKPVVGELENNQLKIRKGQLKTFAIKPNDGYIVQDVLVNGVSVGAVTRYTVESDVDVTIKATFEVAPVPECDHSNVEIRGRVLPTCVNEGYSGDKYCVLCGELLEQGQTMPATGVHTFGEWVVVTAPTTDKEGVEEHTCSVCGHKESRAIAKLPVAPAPDTDAGNSNTGSGNTNTPTPETGDTTKIAGLVVGLGLAAAGIYFTTKKDEE